MKFKPLPGTRGVIDLCQIVVPIYRYDFKSARLHLVGTGFWVTRSGHLITAAHVVRDNMDKRDEDIGPIFAIQTFPDHSVTVRNFRKTDYHPVADLALCETVNMPGEISRPTVPAVLSLETSVVGLPVFTFAVTSTDQKIGAEGDAGFAAETFFGEIVVDALKKPIQLKFSLRLGFGAVQKIYTERRDDVMMPFPCFQSSIPLYGANSGGPVFDARGRIHAVNCSGYGGEKLSFHTLIYEAFSLQAGPDFLNIPSFNQKFITIAEMGFFKRVIIEPPLLNPRTRLISALQWLTYFLKCVWRREMPDYEMHFAAFVDKQ